MKVIKSVDARGNIQISFTEVPGMPVKGVQFKGYSWCNEESESLTRQGLERVAWGDLKVLIEGCSGLGYSSRDSAERISSVIEARHKKICDEIKAHIDSNTEESLSRSELIAELDAEGKLYTRNASGRFAKFE